MSLLATDLHGQDDDALQRVTQTTLLNLIQTLLPFESPQFPQVTPQQLLQRLQLLFPVKATSEPQSMARTFALFDNLALFANPQAMPRDDGIADAEWQRIVATDQLAFRTLRQSLQQPHVRFQDLPLDKQRDYLALWMQSGVSIRRRFYRSTKALVMTTAYSMDSFWRAIGYDGPILDEMP